MVKAFKTNNTTFKILRLSQGIIQIKKNNNEKRIMIFFETLTFILYKLYKKSSNIITSIHLKMKISCMARMCVSPSFIIQSMSHHMHS